MASLASTPSFSRSDSLLNGTGGASPNDASNNGSGDASPGAEYPGANRRNCKSSVARKGPMEVKHLICMVGLPARGKTYIAKKLCRYLNWIGINTSVFNVGEYRRKATTEYNSHQFFLASNTEAMKVRQQVAETALSDCLKWLESPEGGDVAIFDATNVTLERRAMVYKKVVEESNFMCLFIESLCDNPDLISANIAAVKVNGPDYAGMNKEEAVQDFLKRIEHYEDCYVPLGDDESEKRLSYMKVINAGERLVINRSAGNLQSRIGYWLMNIHITPRTIYLTRHGESEMNLDGRIGGNSSLSERGNKYAGELARYFEEHPVKDLRVWTSWMKRTIQTARGIQAPQERWKALNEIDAGICEGMTYEEIKAEHPVDYAARERNKMTYRYPRGESYQDLISRLETVIMELERQENVLVVGHQAVLRCILCYLCEKSLDELPYVKVPLHTLIKLTPVAYGCEVEMIPFKIEAVDTHRPKRNTLDADVVAANICEKIKELSESMSMSRQLSVGQDDRVVHSVGSPRFYD